MILYSINQQNANSVAVVLFIIVHHKIFQIHHRRCSVLFRCYPSQIRFVHDVVSQPLIFPSKTICRGDLTVISHSLLFRREPECVPHNNIHYNVRPKRTNQKNPCGTAHQMKSTSRNSENKSCSNCKPIQMTKLQRRPSKKQYKALNPKGS